MPDIDPLSAEEILTLRRILKNRTRFLMAMWGTIGTGIGAAILAYLLDI